MRTTIATLVPSLMHCMVRAWRQMKTKLRFLPHALESQAKQTCRNLCKAASPLPRCRVMLATWVPESLGTASITVNVDFVVDMLSTLAEHRQGFGSPHQTGRGSQLLSSLCCKARPCPDYARCCFRQLTPRNSILWYCIRVLLYCKRGSQQASSQTSCGQQTSTCP